ncbi:MAG: hypothetical protein ACOWWO_06005 [Peptococcaceae bacterium]
MGEVQVLNFFNADIDSVKLADTVPELKGTAAKLAELKKYLKPQIFWRELLLEEILNGVLIFDGGSFEIDSAYVAQGLKYCKKATLYTVTLGPTLPQYSRCCLAEGRLWEAAVADIFGSQGVEIITERFQGYLKGRYLPQGLFATLRFSPGYGDWSLSAQKQIIRYLGAEDIIKVSANFLLEPVKSITALAGWSKYPQSGEYPQGDRGKGFCRGGSCAYCITWACKK